MPVRACARVLIDCVCTFYRFTHFCPPDIFLIWNWSAWSWCSMEVRQESSPFDMYARLHHPYSDLPLSSSSSLLPCRPLPHPISCPMFIKACHYHQVTDQAQNLQFFSVLSEHLSLDHVSDLVTPRTLRMVLLGVRYLGCLLCY